MALTATAGWLIVQASTMPPVLTLMVAIVGVRTFGLARPVLRYAERLRSHDVVLRMLAERRVEVYEALVPLVPGRLGRRRGDLLTAVVDDVDAELDRELRVRMPVRSAAGVLLVVGVAGTVLAPAAWAVVWALVVAGGGLAGLASYAVARRGAARTERVAVALRARLSDEVVEATSLADELVMWQATDRVADRVGETSDALGRALGSAARWLAAARALVLVATGAVVAGVAVLLAPLVGEGALSGPVLALLVLAPLALADVTLPLADAGALSARVDAATARVDDLTGRDPAVTDPAEPVAAPEGHDLGLVGVSAGWDDSLVLRDLDLAVPAGARVAVVGPSGCGKSTLAALLLRFIDPARGVVITAGTPLTSLALDDVRGRTGLVDDDPHVFATTLVENVRLARPGATDDDVETAFRSARLGPWLDTLPDGLHTWLGDGHADVSGGERARLAVARSLLADHRVLVLDEPTAHLDEATAAELAAEVLDRGDRSVVWITHATAGLDLVDRVVDLAQHTTAHSRASQEELPHV